LISKKSSPLKPLCLPSFGLFGQVVSEKKIFFKSANQKQELPMVAMFVNESELNEQTL
jgi:hypothetical protein